MVFGKETNPFPAVYARSHNWGLKGIPVWHLCLAHPTRLLGSIQRIRHLSDIEKDHSLLKVGLVSRCGRGGSGAAIRGGVGGGGAAWRIAGPNRRPGRRLRGGLV